MKTILPFNQLSRLLTGTVLLVLLLSPSRAVHTVSAAGSTTVRGSLGGAPYQIEIPAGWNGTLLLWSHGYCLRCAGRSPLDDLDHAQPWFLAHDYALAASLYSRPGWAVAEAFHDQMTLLDFLVHRYGTPRRTIAVGGSLGGLVSAGLAQLFPPRFSGALPICGILGSGVGTLNQGPDREVAPGPADPGIRPAHAHWTRAIGVGRGDARSTGLVRSHES